MEWSTLHSALEVALASESRDLEIRFIGGEPLLELPLIRRAVADVDRQSPSGKHVKFSISTNGLLLDEETITFFAQHEFDTQLSFDGIRQAQDIRGRGTFPKLNSLLERIYCDFPGFFRRNLHIASTLYSGNMRHLADSVGYFMSKEVPRITIGPLLTHDPAWRLEDIDELDRQFARIFDASLEYFHLTGEVPVEVLRNFDASYNHHSPSDGAMCGAAHGHGMAVDVDGQVTGCVTFAESYQRLPTEFLRSRLEPMRMGDVRDPTFRHRLSLYPQAAESAGLFHQKRAKYSSYRRCASCAYVNDCSICPTSIGHIPGNTDPDRVPDLPCAFNLIALKYRAMFPTFPSFADLISGNARLPKLVQELIAANR
jgi:sulfatase maturation enzyme AslB (radical SAM superfamily)